MRRWRLVGVGLAVGTIALAGCGEGGGAATTSEAPKFPRSGLQTYVTVDELAKDIKDGGGECANFKTTTGSRFAASSGTCYTSDGKDIPILLFSSDTNKQEQVGIYRSLGKMTGGYGFVEGGNWLINCDKKAACDGYAKILGGRTEVDPLI